MGTKQLHAVHIGGKISLESIHADKTTSGSAYLWSNRWEMNKWRRTQAWTDYLTDYLIWTHIAFSLWMHEDAE